MDTLKELASAIVLVLLISLIVMAGSLIAGSILAPLQCIGIAVIIVAAVSLFVAMLRMVIREEFQRYLEAWKKIAKGE